MDVKVRSLTFFVGLDWRKDLKSALEGKLSIIGEVVDSIKEVLGFKVWTVRASLPPTPQSIDDFKLAVIAEDLSYTYNLDYIAALHYHVASIDRVKEVIEYAIKDLSKVFVSLYGKALSFKRYISSLVSTLNRISNNINNYEKFAKFGFVMNGPLKTPYFPGSVNVDNTDGISASLLYPRYLLKAVNNGVTLRKAITEVAVKIENTILGQNLRGVRYLGLDLSISPWMEDSVVELIERYGRLKNLRSPKTLSTIFNINGEIELASRNVKSIGYNEVMLAIAEDERAKEEVRSGILDLNTLLSLAQVCMNGIDMVAIHGDSTLEPLILDATVIAHIKRKPFGFRVIPVNSGIENVNLGRFGKVPIISYFQNS